jgi:DNA (cytosine-5)-methyltransferase 1
MRNRAAFTSVFVSEPSLRQENQQVVTGGRSLFPFTIIRSTESLPKEFDAQEARYLFSVMSYVEFLSRQLKIPARKNKWKVIDLFAGCGGLALGFEAVGFRTYGFEMDPDACSTYESNLKSPCSKVFLDEETDLGSQADIIIGGPPCQPFSVIGQQRGHKDDRDGFPAFLSAIKKHEPKIAIFENVRGMLYKNKHYFEKILAQLRAMDYIVEFSLLNSVHFGVPQKRERLFVVAHRGHWQFPQPIKEQFTAGNALDDLLQSMPENPKFLTKSMDEYVAKYERASSCIRPRDLHLDEPSRTVTCRNLNGATGDMLRVKLPDGRRRRLTVREGARLQSFPDWFFFSGSEGSQFNQIGNAVPPLLARAIAQSVLDYMNKPFIVDVGLIRNKNLPLQPLLFT